MHIPHLNIGIIHSLIGKNDGVSIVIDQTVHAMVNDMGMKLGNIFFLAAHTSPRFNAETNDIFWHKNDLHKEIIRDFCNDVDEDFDKRIHEKSLRAKWIIEDWVNRNNIDLIIAHNTSHPYNFLTAVGLGMYIEELREKGVIWPKLMVWWHDSYFERDQFANPNPVIKKYLKYLPGTYIDGIAFINKTQPQLAEKLFESLNFVHTEQFMKERAIVVPNTSSIDWNYKDYDWSKDELVHPAQDNYNDTFLRDIGLLHEIDERGFSIDDTVMLLQHTRVVPRKKIETALDFAFALEKRYLKDGKRKCIAVIISGHSGDEQVQYKTFLNDYYMKKMHENPGADVIMLFGEHSILSHRDIIVDKKYYNFYEVPSIIASHGGMGTYFSEVEGFGNNLLEMISFGLPVIINKYDTYKTDIEELGFRFPAIEDGKLTDEAVEDAYQMLVDYKYRNQTIRHNLEILSSRLDHKIIAMMLEPLIIKMFTQILLTKENN